MPKLTFEELKGLRDKSKDIVKLRRGEGRIRIIVHMGACGIESGARNVLYTILEEIENRNVTDVLITTTGCLGLCSEEPMITLEIEGSQPARYGELDEEKVRKVFNEHVLKGKPVTEYLIVSGD